MGNRPTRVVLAHFEVMNSTGRLATGRGPNRIGHRAVEANDSRRSLHCDVGSAVGRPFKCGVIRQSHVIGEKLQRKKLLVPGFHPGNIRAQLGAKLRRKRLVGPAFADDLVDDLSQSADRICRVACKGQLSSMAGASVIVRLSVHKFSRSEARRSDVRCGRSCPSLQKPHASQGDSRSADRCHLCHQPDKGRENE
jgi:hypothetical protein